MPIKSYLAYPVRGRRNELAAALRRLPGCQVVRAINRELLVLVTDTPDERAEEALARALAGVSALEGLGLVAALADAEIDDAPAAHGEAQP
jgi:hypothetical protein